MTMAGHGASSDIEHIVAAMADAVRHVDARATSVETLQAVIDERFDRLERVLGNDLLWSLETTRRMLGGVSDEYIRQLADAGKIERRYQGRRPFFVADSVRAYVQSLPDEP